MYVDDVPLLHHCPYVCLQSYMWHPSAGKRIANIMQGKKLLLHASHGIIVATETIEEAAEVQLKALTSGKPLKLMDEGVCMDTRDKFTKPGVAKEVSGCQRPRGFILLYRVPSQCKHDHLGGQYSSYLFASLGCRISCCTL